MKKETRKYLQRQQKSSALILSVVIVLMVSLNSKAQTLEAGVFGGAAYYLGDLNPQSHFTESNFAYGGLVKYNINPRLSLGLSVTQGNITSDATSYNLDHTGNTIDNLTTKVLEFALQGEINFFPYLTGARNSTWTPYIFGGAATFNFENTNSVSLPFGIGVKMSPTEKNGVNLFWGARKTFTDDLDNIVTIDYQGYNYDWYFYYGLNITFAFRLKSDSDCRNINY